MGKKGMSGVVTTVLLILFGLIAVSIVGALIIREVNHVGGLIEDQTICNTNYVEPLSCIQDGGEVILKYKLSSLSEDIKGVENLTAIVNRDGRSSLMKQTSSDVNGGETRVNRVVNVAGKVN